MKTTLCTGELVVVKSLIEFKSIDYSFTQRWRQRVASFAAHGAAGPRQVGASHNPPWRTTPQTRAVAAMRDGGLLGWLTRASGAFPPVLIQVRWDLQDLSVRNIFVGASLPLIAPSLLSLPRNSVQDEDTP